MKTERNILIAFILNFAFSIFEFVGGIFTGSVAIISDAIHDIGDATSIGASFFLEKKSKKPPNERYTYGYARFSVLGGVITTCILFIGSITVIYNAVVRLITPVAIDYNGMIIFAIIGVFVNFIATVFTRKGDSLNQKAINLHMLEDILGWVVVLIGAVVMRFTDLYVLDPLLSIGVAIFILIGTIKSLKEILGLFLVKTPQGIDIHELKEHVSRVDGVIDVHHIHVWDLDGHTHYATMHVVFEGDAQTIKDAVRKELIEHGIRHVTLELETVGEVCSEKECSIVATSSMGGHHHHHHHHH